ncbi:hypothetical protein GN244_ATG07753 [Phytophthora infestans]|uniref:Uncharacterized protein n=1 Tax=Phytophthora infestans TaxID=4787 RepID=A0A833T5N9_PHYIN|nr:hypothetical protein GN244_ATG07753 [Phytophthora infestans]KAF4131668.1 hypothetical protein GN958_ATG19142 [Phytophthora infestans]
MSASTEGFDDLLNVVNAVSKAATCSATELLKGENLIDGKDESLIDGKADVLVDILDATRELVLASFTTASMPAT